jgi:hypothetical protein
MGSRNRMAMSRALFAGLIAKAADDGVVIKDSTAVRWVARYSDEDAELAAKADVATLVLSRQLRAATIRYNDVSYFVTIGFPECEELPAGLESRPLTPGLFGVAIHELAIRSVASGSRIRDAIEDRFAGMADYVGHSLEAIQALYPYMGCWALDTKYEVTKSLPRLVGSYLASSYIDGPLEFEYNLRLACKRAFESGSRHIPYDLILQGLMSFSWSGFFVELYRCIEQLYAVPRLLELTDGWASQASLRDTAELLEKVLGWRPKEDESLARLLKTGCSSATLNLAIQSFKADVHGDLPNASESAARAIYKARNSHVHFRPSKPTSNFSEAEWNAIIQSMLAIVVDLYGKYGRSFLTQSRA